MDIQNPDDIFKPRLVVQGFQQKDVTDNTYSPVVKMQYVKVVAPLFLSVPIKSNGCCKRCILVTVLDQTYHLVLII